MSQARAAAAESPGTADARLALVTQLEEKGVLGPGLVRDALLVLPRQVLMPQAYVRRSAPGEKPPRWELLDWAARRRTAQSYSGCCTAATVCSSSTMGSRSLAGRAERGRGRRSRRCRR